MNRGRRRRASMPRISRDVILVAAGLVGIAHEIGVQDGERPTLLLLLGAMIGLPAFLRKDERQKPEASSPEPVEQESP